MQEENKTPDIKKGNNANSGLKPIQNKAPQKKKKKMSAPALICIVLVVVVIGIFAAVYFDLGGAKQIAASILKIEPASEETDTEANGKQAELEKWEQALKSKESELNQKEDGLDTKEDDLSSKEAQLGQREAQVAKEEKEADEQREAYLQSVAKIFEKMEVKKAASAISGMDTTVDMARILLYMSSEQAALIMNQMKADLATKILSEMMK